MVDLDRLPPVQPRVRRRDDLLERHAEVAGDDDMESARWSNRTSSPTCPKPAVCSAFSAAAVEIVGSLFPHPASSATPQHESASQRTATGGGCSQQRLAVIRVHPRSTLRGHSRALAQSSGTWQTGRERHITGKVRSLSRPVCCLLVLLGTLFVLAGCASGVKPRSDFPGAWVQRQGLALSVPGGFQQYSVRGGQGLLVTDYAVKDADSAAFLKWSDFKAPPANRVALQVGPWDLWPWGDTQPSSPAQPEPAVAHREDKQTVAVGTAGGSSR